MKDIKQSTYAIPAKKFTPALRWWNSLNPKEQEKLDKKLKIETWADVVKAWENKK